MKKTKTKPITDDDADEMRAEYDFSGGVRGKYYQRAIKGTNVVVLDEDIHQAFPDSDSVNQALQLLLKLARTHIKV